MALPVTPVPARARGGSLRKEVQVRRAPADGFSTPSPPVRSRGGATLIALRGGYSSATPSKSGKASITRASSYSPRALLAAKAKGTPSPLRRARPRPSPPAAPLPTRRVKKLVTMVSYKTRSPTDNRMMLIPMPKPFRAPRENIKHKERRTRHHEDLPDQAIEESVEDDKESFLGQSSTPAGIKYKYSGKGNKAYANGKPDRFARLKRAEQKAVLNF